MAKQKLTDQQKAVLFDKATEPPFSGELLYNRQSGTYLCANCQSEIFSSDNKYDSSCGWPSFDRAIDGSVKYVDDTSHGMYRVEVICANCQGHLGHVFADGPIDTTGQRYCINSLALEFRGQPDR